VGPEFGLLESHVTHWEDTLTTAEIMELAKSRSYYLRSSETIRAKVLTNLDWYLHEHLGHTPGASVGLPYLTLAWRALKA
jgi:hypothetical protein